MNRAQAGTEIPLAVSGLYDGTLASRLFTDAANCAFQSSNAAVATVEADGRVRLLAPGSASVTALYQGTFAAMAEVTVLEATPAVTSATRVTGTVGQAFSYQLTASQPADFFASGPLPPGLSLDSATGSIAGVPSTEGATFALVAVTNANGTGSQQVEFNIAGPASPPTDVTLNASAVSEHKPVSTLVGRLVTTDPNPLDTFAYQLVEGAGATHNANFTIAGDQLLTAAVLDRETASLVSLRVRTTDSSGATFEKVLVLPVMSPPAIAREPAGKEIFPGESAILFVEATGAEPLSYQWWKGTEAISGATSRILEVPNAALTDAGNFRVVVTNNDGSVTSATASLVVNPVSFGKWASSQSQTVASAVLEPGGDYNHDGIPNYLDFAFGVETGLELGIAALPSFSHDATGCLLTYRAANGIIPLIYRILKSTDLTTWQEHQPAPEEVGRTDKGAYTEVQVRIPSGPEMLYLRVQVSGDL